MAKIKLPKGVLKQAKKSAKESGVEIPNKRERREAAREIRQAVRDSKDARPSVKWNLAVGDLVKITHSEAPNLGCVIKVDSSRATHIKDWTQSVTVITKSGRLHLHPRFVTVIQKS